MRGPQGQRLSIVSGILGLASDAEVVRAEFQRARPATVLLGIPYEDLDAVRATSGSEASTEFDSGELDDVYLERLAAYGPTRSPPPDLYAAWELASEAKVPVEAVDLADEPFSDVYAKNVGMFEVLRSSRNHRRIPSLPLEASTAEEFALAWDDALYPTKGLRRVQAAREDAMATRLGSLGVGSHLALLPLPRVSGVVVRLQARGWSTTG